MLEHSSLESPAYRHLLSRSRALLLCLSFRARATNLKMSWFSIEPEPEPVPQEETKAEIEDDLTPQEKLDGLKAEKEDLLSRIRTNEAAAPERQRRAFCGARPPQMKA